MTCRSASICLLGHHFRAGPSSARPHVSVSERKVDGITGFQTVVIASPQGISDRAGSKAEGERHRQLHQPEADDEQCLAAISDDQDVTIAAARSTRSHHAQRHKRAAAIRAFFFRKVEDLHVFHVLGSVL